jgi:VanZ family protein
MIVGATSGAASVSGSRFAAAALVAAGLVLSAPFIGEVRRAIRSAFPGHFVAVVGVIVAVSICAALAVALARIRQQRARRYGLLAAAVVFAAAYAFATRSGIPDVDVVERFHFVEYGLVTWLFYRAWRPLDDAAVFVGPALCAMVVGTADEWLQWFVPARIGEMRDVFLNSAAIGAGLLFSTALEPPARRTLAFGRESRRTASVAAAIAIVSFAAFVHAVHLGYDIRDEAIGSFRSRYTARALDDLARDRAVRWSVHPPPNVPPRISREDQYLSEAVWHVQKRNEQWSAGNVPAAWRENLILERYYPPVVALPLGYAWPAAQRAEAEARAAGDKRPYVSDAQQYPIYIWPRTVFWAIVGAVAIAIVLVGRRENAGARAGI